MAHFLRHDPVTTVDQVPSAWQVRVGASVPPPMGLGPGANPERQSAVHVDLPAQLVQAAALGAARMVLGGGLGHFLTHEPETGPQLPFTSQVTVGAPVVEPVTTGPGSKLFWQVATQVPPAVGVTPPTAAAVPAQLDGQSLALNAAVDVVGAAAHAPALTVSQKSSSAATAVVTRPARRPGRR